MALPLRLRPDAVMGRYDDYDYDDEEEGEAHLRVALDHESAVLPTRAYSGDAGWDLYACESVIIAGGSFQDVPLGFRMAIPDGHFGFITGRSSTYRKRKLRVDANVIDCGYRGPMFAGVHNMAPVAQTVAEGKKIAQLLILPVPTIRATKVDDLPESDRGSKGFGSSGV